jgi:hypothetical protein
MAAEGFAAGVAAATGFSGTGTPCAVAGDGAGLGRLSFSQASQSMSKEKLKITSRISRWVSIWSRERGRVRRDAMDRIDRGAAR